MPDANYNEGEIPPFWFCLGAFAIVMVIAITFASCG